MVKEPVFRTNFSGLFIEFTARNSSEIKKDISTSDSDNKKKISSVKIIELICKNKNITIPELAKKIGLAQGTFLDTFIQLDFTIKKPVNQEIYRLTLLKTLKKCLKKRSGRDSNPRPPP